MCLFIPIHEKLGANRYLGSGRSPVVAWNIIFLELEVKPGAEPTLPSVSLFRKSFKPAPPRTVISVTERHKSGAAGSRLFLFFPGSRGREGWV